MPRQCNCSRLFALGCMVLAATLLLPPRLFADPVARPTSILASARSAAVREAATLKERRATQTPPTATTDLRSGSFFKSKAGVATLVIVGIGAAYALYSASNDRIKSTGR